jgi:glycosyltransferase involved in cell wall biosynthesis
MTHRILKVSDAWSYTAEADNLMRVAAELTRRGHHVTLACKGGTPLAARAAAQGLAVRLVRGLRPGWNVAAGAMAPWSLARVIKDLSPDVLHPYRSSVHTLAIAARALAGSRAPVVRTRANVDHPRTGRLSRLIYDQLTARTVVTADAVRARLTSVGFRESRLVTIYGAVDTQRFDPDQVSGQAVRHELGLPDDAVVLTCLARLAPVKGHTWLLDAFRKLQALQSADGVWLVLVGQSWPGMWDRIRRYGEELGVMDRVIWTDRRDDIPEILAASDVGVVASVGSEALSRACLEYMAMGLPIVATAVGGIPELVPAGAGTLVPPEDPESMSKALAALVADASARRTLGQAGRQRVLESFTVGTQVAQLETVYAQVLRDGQPDTAAADLV